MFLFIPYSMLLGGCQLQFCGHYHKMLLQVFIYACKVESST